MPTEAVGKESARQPDDRHASLIGAVDDAVGEGGKPERVDDIERKDCRDHLRGDVGEEADQAKQDDVAGDARNPPGHECGVAAEKSPCSLDLVHHPVPETT
jgi:hypothetical protein